MIALVTDSNAQLPDVIRDRYGVFVVPLTVVVDGVAYREGVDLSHDEFYDALERGASVSTSTPSPGEVAAVYRAAVDAGAGEILSIHVGSNTSGTVGAVRLAAADAAVAVEIVDTGTASFGVACCVWAAGDAIGRGADLRQAAAAAADAAAGIGNVFLLRTLEQARRGGRLRDGGETESLAIHALRDGKIETIASSAGGGAAVDVMVDAVADRAQSGQRLRVGVGDARVPDEGDALASRLAALDGIEEVVRYRVGPSVAAHTGLGTVGAVYYPVG